MRYHLITLWYAIMFFGLTFFGFKLLCVLHGPSRELRNTIFKFLVSI